ncbi:MAG: HAMP domain-containing histidine kinase [Oscillospiraceae bacterium]|nr:HAMP domain-containing histidine kinase [Oscillospiraceae bacterium]
MRLFAKLFICATLVICIALLVSGYLLITFSHERALSREAERAINQYQYDKFTAQAGLIANVDTFSEEFSERVLQQLSADASGLLAFFTENKTLLYSELPAQTDFIILSDVPDNSYVHQFQEVDGGSYIMVCSKLTQGNVKLYFLVATDISDVVAQKEQMAQSFVKVYFITLLLSVAVILILSAFITRPIKRVIRAAADIARGQYNERLPTKGGDEISELSKSFNIMTDAVEDKIVELEESARQKEDFVANFAHELKTPLTSVIGYADMLYQKSLPLEQVKDAASYILSEGLRLESLSLKLLDLIVLNRQDFVLEDMRSDELFENIAGSLKPLLEERKASLIPKIDPASVMVEYDLFKTLMLNLIDNATKAGGHNIKIVGSQNGSRYSVSVNDDGRGIPETELSKITEAFYMVDKSRSRKQHGAGLGLSLAAKIAKVHGSTLEFSSIEGIGTIVKLDLALGGIEDNE